MREITNRVDGQAHESERRDTSVAVGTPALTRQLTLWYQGSTPVKLVVSEPNEFGGMTEETNLWFVDGEVRVVIAPFDGYYLEDNRILLWTDGTLTPQPEVSREALDQEENLLISRIHDWLTVFAIPFP